MVEFGTSGVSEWMKDAKLTYKDVVKELNRLGLKCFEYPFTHGTNITESKCAEIGEIFKSGDIKLSVHAPYFINLASPDDAQIQKSFVYIYESMRKAKIMGADRVVFHPGSLTSQTREVAFNNVYENLKKFIASIDGDENVSGVYICPETMGKHGQIGTVDEILKLCTLSDKVIPTLDFGHINAFTGGGINSVESYIEILNKYICDKNNIQIHFSKIQYGAKGEIKHLTFDTDIANFGPDPTQLVYALKGFDENNIRVICESDGTQDKDAKFMLDIFKK